MMVSWNVQILSSSNVRLAALLQNDHLWFGLRSWVAAIMDTTYATSAASIRFAVRGARLPGQRELVWTGLVHTNFILTSHAG